MTDAPFMQFYVADYLGDTQHLTAEQHGAYLLLLMTMWRAGGVLPNEPSKLARIARVSTRRWTAIEAEVMAFFTVDGDTISQKRLAREYQKAVSVSESRSSAGRAGAKAKYLKNNKSASANAKAELKQGHKPEARSQTTSVPSSDETEVVEGAQKRVPAFSEFFDVIRKGPTASRPVAEKQWLRTPDAEKIMAVQAVPEFNRHCDADPTYAPVHPWKFLAEKRWEGFAKSGLAVVTVLIHPGSPEWAAWLDYKRGNGERTNYMEAQGREGKGFAVPSRFPPRAEAA